MNGMKFKGVHCRDLGLHMKSLNRPIFPTLQDNHIEIPQRAGSHLFAGKPDDKIIELELGFVESNTRELRLRLREIANWLHSIQMERLYFDDEPDKYYLAKVSNQIDFGQAITRLGVFTVFFRCFPYALGEDKVQRDVISHNRQSSIVQAGGNVFNPPHLTVQNTGTNTIKGFTIEIEQLNN